MQIECLHPLEGCMGNLVCSHNAFGSFNSESNLQVHGRVKPKQHKGLLVRSGVLQSLCHWVACIVIKCGKRHYKASPIEVYDLCPYCKMVISHTYIIIICHTYRYDL